MSNSDNFHVTLVRTSLISLIYRGFPNQIISFLGFCRRHISRFFVTTPTVASVKIASGETSLPSLTTSCGRNHSLIYLPQGSPDYLPPALAKPLLESNGFWVLD